MLFSIIIPVYNVENYLQECIDSVINQILNYSIDAEILLLNDGSTDISGEICDFNRNKYPDIIKVIHKNNEGLLSTRRRGILLSRGEYIINCDSDDLLSENALYELKKIICKIHPDIVVYNMGILNSDNKKTYYEDYFTKEKYIRLEKKQVLDSYFIDNYPVVTTMAGKAIRSTCFDLKKDYTHFYKDSFGEDTLQSAEVYEKAEKIVYLNEVLYYYRTSIGMSSQFKEDYYTNFIKIIEYVSNYSYISNNEEFNSRIVIKILNVLARSITQSRNCKSLNYKIRKKYLSSLYEEKYVKNVLSVLNQNYNFLDFKYFIILIMFKYKMFLLLHMILS
ncbi:MAG: glycosyltransferase family 2 protein [Anaerococcus vaginalis]|nr:glycosyltransferase family 2 protein [Anaerococcus vaginalis]